MFVEVPDPVWNTSIGNCASCLPIAISAAAFSIRAARRLSSRPSSPLTAAAAPFTRASQRTTDTGTVSPEIGKLSTALVVSPPHSCFSVLIDSPCERVSNDRRKVSRAPVRARAHRLSLAGYPQRAGDGLPTERHQLARDSDGIVVGHQHAGAGQHAQLPAR